MDTLQASVLTLKTSSKIPERKRAAETIMELIGDGESEELCTELNEISMKKSAGNNEITWNVIFDAARDYFHTETDRLIRLNNLIRNNTTKNFYLSIVDRVLRKGTSPRPTIKWSKVITFFTEYLSQDVYAVAYGQAIISMLQHFLSIEVYVQLIDGKSWIELIKLLIKFYMKFDISHNEVLQCLNIAIQEGANHPTVIGTLRLDVVQFYERVFTGERTRYRFEVVHLLRGVTDLCRRNAVEFRVTLCRLGESILPSVLHRTTYINGEETAIIEFLLVQLQIHSPFDTRINSEAFFASDPLDWIEILKEGYAFCMDSIEDIASRKLSHHQKAAEVPQRLILLAAKLTKQIADLQVEENSTSGDEEDPNPAKKIMRYRSFNNVLTDLCSRLPIGERHVVWMNYLIAVLSEFPSLVGGRMNFSSLFHMGLNVLHSSFVTRREVYVFFLCLLKTEKFLILSGVLKTRTISWEDVWEVTLRSLSMNESKTEAMELLRKLLIEVQPSSINSLLLLYVNGSMPVSIPSLILLAEFLSKCSLPLYFGSDVDSIGSNNVNIGVEIATTCCPRLALIRWLVNCTEEPELGHEPLISTILCSLLVRQTHNLIHAEQPFRPAKPDVIVSELSQYEIVYEDFEKIILQCNFLRIPKSTNAEGTEIVRPTRQPLQLSLIPSIPIRLLEALQEDFEKQPVEIRHIHPEFCNKLTKLNYRVAVYLNIVNMLEKHSIGGEDGIGFRTNLDKLFDKALSRWMEIATDFIISRGRDKNPEHVQEVLAIMRNILRSEHLCDRIKTVLAQRVPQQMQELLKKIYRSNLGRYLERAKNNHGLDDVLFRAENTNSRISICSNSGDTVCVTEGRQIELAALEALNSLIDYGVLCDHRYDLFTEILKDCLNEAHSAAVPFVFEFSTEATTKISAHIKEGTHSDLLTLLISIYQKMCKAFFKLPHCMTRLWELFIDTTSLAAKEPENMKNLMSLVGSATPFLSNTELACGSSISSCEAGFRALGEIAKNDPHLTLSWYNRKTTPFWILGEMYEFLGSPSNQVRLYAANAICLMFEHAAPPVQHSENSAPENSVGCVEKRQEYYDKVYQKLSDNFNVPATLTPYERRDEAINRTSLSLSCLTRLIFAYPFIQKKTVYSLVLFCKMKGIDVLLTNKALKFSSSAADRAMTCHVSILLEKWLDAGYHVEDFPYQFLGYDTLLSFYGRFRKEISLELFRKNDTAGIGRFADYFNLKIPDLIKESFGMITSRILPGLTVYKQNNEPPPDNIDQLTEDQDRLNTLLGGKRQTENLISTCLADVVLQLVSLLFDPLIPSEWGCELQLPEPSIPYLDGASINIVIKGLMNASSHKDCSVIAFLSVHRPHDIYNNLLKLMLAVHNSHNALEKFWRLHQFSFFVKLLTVERPNVYNNMSEYVSQFVVHAYLRLLHIENGNGIHDRFVRDAILFLISKFFVESKMCYAEEMKHHYNVIVQGLICKAVKFPDVMRNVKKWFGILMRGVEDVFYESIKCLDPFPSNAEFDEFREIRFRLKYGTEQRAEWSLERELRSCLNDIKSSSGFCTKERLVFVRELLINKRRDLEKLVRSLENKRFSDECTSDTLHCLIQLLVGIIKDGRDSDTVLEAARCLGEIGPVDLSVLVLPPCPYNKKPLGVIQGGDIPGVVAFLAEYLKSVQIHLVTRCGKVLRSILQVTECYEAVGKKFPHGTRMDALLKPFQPKEHSGKISEKVVANQLEAKLGLNEMDEFVDYTTWVSQLTCGLVKCFKPEDSLVAKLLPICELEIEFCQEILPFVFHQVLLSGRSNPLVRKTVSGYFRNFFNKFVSSQITLSESSRSFTPVLGAHCQLSIYLNMLALRQLLGVVQYLRELPAPAELKSSELTPWDNNFWLDLNYLDLAKAAQYCGAYLTSILFTEIAATDLDMGGTSHIDEMGEEDGMESFYSQGLVLFPRNRGDSFEKLLLKAYISIGEPDAAYGCGSARFSDSIMNIRHLQQRRQWSRVLSACDGNTADSESTLETGVCSSMKELGLYNSLWTHLKGIESRDKILDSDLAAIQYECGWRLSKWNLHSDRATYNKDLNYMESGTTHGMFQRFVYESIQTGLENDVVNHLENVKNGYNSVAIDLKHASIESSENLYGFLSCFQIIRVIEDFFQLSTTPEIPSIGGTNRFLQKWKAHDKASCSDFKYQEPVLYLRGILLRSHNEKYPRPELDHAYDDCMLELVAKARDSGRLEFAENCVNCISGSSDRSLRKELEIAKNFWARGDEDIAKHFLGRLLKKSSPEGCELYPAMLLLYGDWLSKTMADRPSQILDKYLSRSCQIYEKKGNTSANLKELAKAHFVLAKYADLQYHYVTNYMKSEIFIEKCTHNQQAKASLATMQHAQDTDVRRTATVLRKQCLIDEEEIKATTEERKKFMVLALQHYLKGLRNCNDQELLIFRAVQIWLENSDSKDKSIRTEVNKIFKGEELPSYKYIIVLHQLSARLSEHAGGVADILNPILAKCASEHPFHTLPVVLTQALLHKDQEVAGGSRPPSRSEDRVRAAEKLVVAFKRNRRLGLTTEKMDLLWKALISLANQSAPRNTTATDITIPQNAAIRSLESLEEVAVPTTTIPVIPSGLYGGYVIGIKKIGTTYGLVGGINSPKRIFCIGTNGRKFNMLLKGQDDLRQDAVMQQVFGVINKLLLEEPKTKLRRLHIRTYKVVPLSQRTGILEWCENTQTFGDYLVDPNHGAHQKYRKNDYKPLDCRRKMMDVKDCADNEKKYGNFMTILEHFKPVFRHFFFENFKDPGTFFERRLAYTHSVATNSMVGYILGLGDRHVLNILVDKTTAELIHIDLGVAFEQGRILPTPETIPFRLTRDVVDGMGVTGVEGVFRKSCEMTLEVLRKNHDIILTILGVLLYDPLYMWTLTPDRVSKVQPTDSNRPRRMTVVPEEAPSERNSSAARVLLRLRHKLDGYEDGGSSGSALSVPGHVSLLIQQAMDPERLSRLFPGWQPYL